MLLCRHAEKGSLLCSWAQMIIVDPPLPADTAVRSRDPLQGSAPAVRSSGPLVFAPLKEQLSEVTHGFHERETLEIRTVKTLRLCRGGGGAAEARLGAPQTRANL